MFRSLKAALCLSGVMLACPAEAASYLTYTFETVGNGSFTNTRVFPAAVTPLYNLIFSFSFATDSGAIQDTAQGQSILVPYGNGASVLSVTNKTLQLDAFSIPNQFESIFRLSLGTAVYDNLGGVFTASPIGVDTANSFVSYTAGSGSGNTEYSGKVVAVSAIEIETRPAETGLRIVFGVPEPSTWAMMLVGFGMTGYAMRRRRASLSIAA